MQKAIKDTEDILQTIPEHFPSTSSNNSESLTIPAATAIERPQNFSFSTSYTATRFGNSVSQNNKINIGLPTEFFETKPISAFTVLNIDDLATSFRAKPNAIVHPFRRPEHPLPGPLHSNDSDSGVLLESRKPQHRNLESSATQYGDASTKKDRQAGHSFAEELNRKLRFLHQTEKHDPWKKSRNSSNYGSNLESVKKRPLFITTVPSGIFLPPAKTSPLPPSLRSRTYAYSSYPVVFNSNYNNNAYSYNNNENISTFSKAKFRGSTAPIGAADKEFTTFMTNSTCRNKISIGGRATRGETVGYTHSTHGAVPITKQQFNKQIQQQRTKRESLVEPYKNVMHEKRVVRGSNFGGTNLLADTDPFDKAAELRRRQALRKKTQARNQRNILGTPPPVKGRCHEVIQTEKYLEELVERPPEFSVDTQTDLFLERPPTPPYIPAKVGIDVGTEIGEGELFHFDAEAQPIIDILVDACIEQSMLEVAHEQEIEALRKKQEEFLAQREAELAELRRLEAEEIRLQAEKERRLRQDAIAKELDEEMQKGVTAAKLLQGHIAGLLPEVLENLEPATDAAKKEKLMKTICPWLTVEVAEEVGQIVDSREILTVIIQEIIKQRATVYAGYKEDMLPELELPAAICYEDEGLGEPEIECCTCESEESEGCPQPPIEEEKS